MRWFRFYSEVLHDPKVQRLSPDLFKVWINILCLANENPSRGELPPVADIAWALRISDGEAQRALDALCDARLIDCDGETRAIHGWDSRQAAADNSSARVAKYRERFRERGENPNIAYKRREVLDRDGNACVYCGSTKNLVIEHMVPNLLGGTNDPDNLAAGCKSCNSGKAGRTPEQAGMVFLNKDAEQRYLSYVSRCVTVTQPNVSPNSHALDKNRIDKNREEQNREEEGAREFADFVDKVLFKYPKNKSGRKPVRKIAESALKKIATKNRADFLLSLEHYAVEQDVKDGFVMDIRRYVKDEWIGYLEPAQERVRSDDNRLTRVFPNQRAARAPIDPSKYAPGGKYGGLFSKPNGATPSAARSEPETDDVPF